MRCALVIGGVCALLASCGGEAERQATRPPRLPPALAARLAQRADAVASRLDAGDPCGAAREAAALQQTSIDAINGGRIPHRFQEELQAVASELAADAQDACTSVSPPTTTAEQARGRGKHKGKKKHGDGDE